MSVYPSVQLFLHNETVFRYLSDLYLHFNTSAFVIILYSKVHFSAATIDVSIKHCIISNTL